LDDFYEGDPRRLNSFVTNFGDWQLPPDVEQVIGGPVGHLEWVHDTGDLVLFGAVPDDHDGPRVRLLPWGVGATRPIAEGVPADTQVAILGVIGHGPAVHELLWGWHLEHGSPAGWGWLVGKLAGLT
jgi:hypothetical protein